MSEPSNQAERFHRARVEFVEAMEVGCSILELRHRKADARARLRQRAQAEVMDRTADHLTQPQQALPFQRDWIARSDAWMMRD